MNNNKPSRPRLFISYFFRPVIWNCKGHQSLIWFLSFHLKKLKFESKSPFYKNSKSRQVHNGRTRDVTIKYLVNVLFLSQRFIYNYNECISWQTAVFYAHIFFFDLLKTVVKITQSMRVDNINFILCRQKWDFSWLFTIFRFDIKIDEYIRYDPKFRHLHRSSKVYGVLMYGRSNCICNQTNVLNR